MMLAGVRPTIRFASAPIARTRFVFASIATTDGSLITIPRSRTWTRVLAVPRSIPMSREKRPRKRSSMVAGRSFECGGRIERRGSAGRADRAPGCQALKPEAVYPRRSKPPVRAPATRAVGATAGDVDLRGAPRPRPAARGPAAHDADRSRVHRRRVPRLPVLHPGIDRRVGRSDGRKAAERFLERYTATGSHPSLGLRRRHPQRFLFPRDAGRPLTRAASAREGRGRPGRSNTTPRSRSDDPRVVTDDQVVEQVDVEEAPGRQRLRGEVEVIAATAWGRRWGGCGRR